MKRQPWLRLVALLAAGSLIAAACGDDDDDAAADEDGDEAAQDDGATGELEPVPGFDGETINVGALTPTSGLVAIIGNPLTAGNQAYIDSVNEQGGVAGQYPIELVVQDTAYDPSQASQAYASTQDDVVMYVQLLGTPIVDALLPDLIDDDSVAGPATLDSDWVREPNLIPIGAPYQIQAINGIDWYYTEEGSGDETLCTLASDDEYGDAGVAGAQFAADELGIEIAEEATFPAPTAERPAQDFGAQISQLQDAECEVIWFVATPTDSGAFADALNENPDYNPTVLAQSPTWLGAFAGNTYMQENFYIVAEGPAYGDESVPGMAEMISVQEEYAPADENVDIYFQFGYNEARAAVQVLEQAVEMGDLSREGILAALEEIDTLTFDGLLGDYQYGPADERVPPTTNSIFRPSAELAPPTGTGLELVVQDYEADYAADFEF